MTRLDEIIKRAAEDESARQEFYQEFLNTKILIPTQDGPEGEESGPRKMKEGEEFSPVVVESEGKLYLPVFDDVEKLQNFTDQQFPYIEIPSFALLPNINEEVSLVLNPNTDYAKEFHQDEIEMLNQAVSHSASSAYDIPENAEINVEDPSNLPDELEERLGKILSLKEEVTRGFIAQVEIEGHHDEPTLLLVVEIVDDVEDEGRTLKEIYDKVAETLSEVLSKGTSMDMAVHSEENRLTSKVVNSVDSFYQKA